MTDKDFQTVWSMLPTHNPSMENKKKIWEHYIRLAENDINLFKAINQTVFDYLMDKEKGGLIC